MARNKGVAQFAVNFEPGGQTPLDARTLVATKADLTAAESFGANIYNGLLVSVEEDSTLWMLKDMSKTTDIANWKQIDSDASAEEIRELQNEILNLKTTVGDADSGLVKSVTDNTNAISAEKTRAEAAEEALSQSISGVDTAYKAADTLLDGKISAEKTRAEAAESDLQDAIDAEVTRATGIEAGLRIDVNKKVASVGSGSSGITIGGTATAPTVVLKTSDSGNVKFTQNASGISANVNIPAATVTGVKANDKVIGLDGTELTSTISIDYVTSAHTIYLKGKENVIISEIDASAFIKDGMLDSAELVINPDGQTAGTYIKLTFNTEAGKDPIFINVTSLIDIYLAGDGLKLSGHTFSVKVKDSDKYLEVTADGIASKGIDTAIGSAKTEITEVIGTGFTSASTVTTQLAAVKATADAAAVQTAVTAALNEKVDKIDGKGLSTNDYTTDEKTKLAGIASGAQVNVIESVTVNGIDASVVDKNASLDIEGKNVAIGTDIKDGENIVYSVSTKVDVVLQGIQNSIKTAVQNSLNSVKAGDGVAVSAIADNKQTISAKVSTDAGNILKLGSDKGLFAALYYLGNDTE